MQPAPISEPFTRDELVRDLVAVRAWSGDFWRRFEPPEFFAPIGEGWSPADHVRHLVKANRPVAMAMGLPRLVLRLRFGRAKAPSRSYSALVANYYEALRGGLRAGRFSPAPLPPERQTPEQREESLAFLDTSLEAVIERVRRWPERALDRLRLPHPGIGRLTVREMVMFTLYHNTHHVLGLERSKGL